MISGRSEVISVASIQQRMSILRLAGMKSSIAIRLKEAEETSMAYGEFLSLVLEDEIDSRNDSKQKKLHKQARLPGMMRIEDFDFSFQPSIQKRTIQELATGKFLTTATNVVFTGQPGTGKTHLATGLGLRTLAMGRSVLYTTLWDLIDKLNQGRADLSVEKRLRSYLRPDLLIIDELGYKPLSPQAVQDFFEIIARRYQEKPVIITSNRDISEWDKIFHDKTLTTALLDRLIHHCDLIDIKGESYRMRHHKDNTAKILRKDTLP